jgi:ABC-type microcin C transport system permease subunit YejE
MWIQISTFGEICIVDSIDVLIRIHDESMQSMSRKDPNTYLISMLKIASKFVNREPFWRIWLIERLFFWVILKEFLRGDRELLKKINWNKVAEASLTLGKGRIHIGLTLFASICLHSMRVILIRSALVLSKLKQ